MEFRMPKLGLTMEEGTIVTWLAADGEPVERGAAVLVVATDKVETDIESPGSGRLHRVGIEGTTHACGALVAWLLADGEEPPAVVAPDQVAGIATAPAPVVPAPPSPTTNGAVSTGRLLASPNARRVAALAGVDLRRVRGTGPGGRVVSEDVEALVAAGAQAPSATLSALPARPVGTGGRVSATMAARTLADLLGVDVATVPASSPDGRVGRGDVAAHVRRLLAHPAPVAVPTAPTVDALAPPTQEPTDVVPFAGVRGTIAARMHASLRDMAQLTLTMVADMDAVVADREDRRAADPGGRLPGFTDYVVAAAARALRAHPIVNSQVVDGGIALLPRVHVGVAVAAARGLLVPVVRDADRLGLAALAAETSRLADAARGGTLRLQELEGGTFSVSALGMFGVDAFTPVVNPPNTAILGVGRLRDDVAWNGGGRAVPVKRLTLSFTWDHRVLDGAPAAEFCRTIVEHLENPSRLADP